MAWVAGGALPCLQASVEWPAGDMSGLSDLCRWEMHAWAWLGALLCCHLWPVAGVFLTLLSSLLSFRTWFSPLSHGFHFLLALQGPPVYPAAP